jgi:hypothetical protein
VLTGETVLAQKIDPSLQAPAPDQLDHVTISPNSAVNWYTPDSLVRALPLFVPREGTYVTKLPLQKGTFTLKNGGVLLWMAAGPDSIVIYSEKGEQLYQLATNNIETRDDGKHSVPLPMREQSEINSDRDLFPIRTGGKVGFIDAGGKIVIPQKFNSRGLSAYFSPEEYFHDGLSVAYDDEGGGYIDQTGNFVIKGRIIPQGSFAGDLARVYACSDMRTVECKLGFINRQGKYVVPPQFTRGEDFSEGLAAVEINGKWGYVDRSGAMEIAPRFDTAHSFHGGFSLVEISNVRRGWINKTGEFLPMPDEVEDFGMLSEGLIAVKIQGKWGFIDTSGKLVIPAQFDPNIDEYHDDNYRGEGAFSCGLAPIKLKGKWGYINHRGDPVIQPQFERAEPFDQDVAAVSIGGKWGYVRPNGEAIISPRFDRVGHFQNGLAAVCAHDKCGFLNTKGNLAIPLQFDDVADFSDGLAAVKRAGWWGYVNEAGSMVIMPQFISPGHFHNGLAVQKIKEFLGIPSPSPGYHDEWGYINRSGGWVWRTTK